MNLRIASVLIFGLVQSVHSDDSLGNCPETEFCVGFKTEAENERCEDFPDFGTNYEPADYPDPLPFGCTYATLAFLGQLPEATDPAALAIDLFKYGKYCGLNNRCSKYETGADKCFSAPKPCDDIDGSCQKHDLCLDKAIVDEFGTDLDGFNPDLCDSPFEVGCESNIDVQDRVDCDIDFINDLAEAFFDSLSEDGDPTPTKRCDANFYGFGLIDIVKHESVLIAAPFCCSSAFFCDCDDARCANARAFCAATVYGEVICPGEACP